MHPVTRLLLVCFVASFCRLPAQEAPPADPFVKARPSAKPPDAAGPHFAEPNGPEALPADFLLTLETYTFSQEALDALFSEGLDARHLYDRVRKIASEGTGSLDSVISLPTRSGMRATSESIDEVTYATEFDPPVPGRLFGFPTAYEMRPTGHRVEFDPVMEPDNRMVTINIVPEFVRLAGFVTAKAGEKAEGEIQPLFTSRRTQQSISCPVGVPTLLGTTSRPKNTGLPAADGDGSMSVTFSTVVLPGSHKAAASKEAAPNDGNDNLRLVFRFYSLPRTTARDLLTKFTDADTLHSQVRALPASDMQMERLITMETRSGQRASFQEIAENIYGTEFEPSHPPRVREKKNPTPASAPGTAQGAGQAAQTTPSAPPVFDGKDALPPAVTAFEMRPVGWSIEVDPVVYPDDRTVDLNLAPQFVQHRGNLQGHTLFSRYPDQPVFGTQKITTSVSTTVGHQCFLGTMSAPHDTGVNGRTDDGRAWFAFVIVTRQ
jgi:hypothetical protein